MVGLEETLPAPVPGNGRGRGRWAVVGAQDKNAASETAEWPSALLTMTGGASSIVHLFQLHKEQAINSASKERCGDRWNPRATDACPRRGASSLRDSDGQQTCSVSCKSPNMMYVLTRDAGHQVPLRIRLSASHTLRSALPSRLIMGAV